MTDEQARKLERIHNRATKYEAVVVRQDGERRLLAYSGRKSRSGLLVAARERGKAVVAFLGLSDADEMRWSAGAFTFTTGAAIRWSGRTQRDAILGDELTYIGA